MHDQRVEAGPGLGGEYRGDGMVVCRVAAEPIDGLGRERDEPPGLQQRGGTGDRRRAGWGNVSHQRPLRSLLEKHSPMTSVVITTEEPSQMPGEEMRHERKSCNTIRCPPARVDRRVQSFHNARQRN